MNWTVRVTIWWYKQWFHCVGVTLSHVVVFCPKSPQIWNFWSVMPQYSSATPSPLTLPYLTYKHLVSIPSLPQPILSPRVNANTLQELVSSLPLLIPLVGTYQVTRKMRLITLLWWHNTSVHLLRININGLRIDYYYYFYCYCIINIIIVIIIIVIIMVF